MTNNLILLLLFLVFVAVAGLFAGAETGVYQLSRLRLRLGIEKKLWAHMILGKSLADAPALLISLLLGMNLAQYFATSSMTYVMLDYINNEQTATLAVSLVTTPLFFIFAELLPKNLFYCRADRIMPVVSPMIYVFYRLARLSGAVWLLKSFSMLASRSKSKGAGTRRTSMMALREHFEAVLLDTHEEKILSPVQTGMMWRLRSISRMGISSVMTPLAKVEMLDVKSTKADLLKKLRRCRHSRYPVYDGWRTNIIGFVNIYDCLADEKDFMNLHGLVNKIHELAGGTSVLKAINIIQQQNEKIILVIRSGRGKTAKPLGVITMKDLAEELLGELGEW